MYKAQKYDPETKTWVCDPWDRSKQTYWISRQSNGIMRMSDNQKVCDFPKYSLNDTKLVEKICFAYSDEEAIRIADEYINSEDYKKMLEDDCLMFLLNQEEIRKRTKIIDELRKRRKS
jgi:hypothetical protein